MELAQVAATLRAYVSRGGALEAVAVVEEGIVRCDGTGAVTLEREEAGEPQPLDWRAAEPADLGLELKRLPPFDVDPVGGEVTGVLGGLEHVAEGVRALAGALGGRSVALAVLPTSDGTPLAISAREGEGLVVVIDDEQFEMEAGWPPQRPAPGAS